MQVPKFILQIFAAAYAFGGLQAIIGFEDKVFFDLLFVSMIVQQLPTIQWNFLAFIVDMTRILKKDTTPPPTPPSPPPPSTPPTSSSERNLLSLSDYKAKEKVSQEKAHKDSPQKEKAA